MKERITLSIFFGTKILAEFAFANITHKSLWCDLLLGANRRFGATKAPFVQKKNRTTLGTVYSGLNFRRSGLR